MAKHVHHHIDKSIHERSRRSMPLSGTFMIFSMLGLIMSVTYTLSGRFQTLFAWSKVSGYGWGIAFILVFLFMFIAAVMSVTPSGPDLADLDDAIEGRI